ncbi:hypothetical protein CMEL01_02979 [Colletotrichum melonis]|uniref:Uncharacterized protein n=1 Tax=Colletotrichum melonis TaxID=1209925 RepID=A0AAI9UK59_9PEZI|nr:hypothetical protein CMEL01_02979 [Colletotrichum melonis]
MPGAQLANPLPMAIGYGYAACPLSFFSFSFSAKLSAKVPGWFPLAWLAWFSSHPIPLGLIIICSLRQKPAPIFSSSPCDCPKPPRPKHQHLHLHHKLLPRSKTPTIPRSPNPRRMNVPGGRGLPRNLEKRIGGFQRIPCNPCPTRELQGGTNPKASKAKQP